MRELGDFEELVFRKVFAFLLFCFGWTLVVELKGIKTSQAKDHFALRGFG